MKKPLERRVKLVSIIMEKKLLPKFHDTVLPTIGNIRIQRGEEAAETAAETVTNWILENQSEEEILQKLDQL